MKPRTHYSLSVLAVGLFPLLMAMSVWAQTNSHARIVRLSFVEGQVAVERPDAQAWSQAPVNTPLQEGFKLSTGENSYAEIQFENGSTIRLGEQARLDFTQLQLAPDGSKINRVDLRQGYATFHPLASGNGESLQVETTLGTLIAQGGSQFRVDLDQGLERVEVFDGSVDVQSNLGAMTIQSDSVLVMQPGASDPTSVSQGITKDDWDQWVDNREAQLQMPSAGPPPGSYAGEQESAYGWSDLSQYGDWADVPGAGYGWSPRADNGWSPYSNGQWCWYAGLGYTWIGAEPWGWLPYHYGGWDFIPGRGWVWFPGNLTNWSPGLVTWYHGSNWVGWIPRTHRKDGSINCGNHCGGGVVSTSTFRQGGALTSNLMLGVNPTTGERASQPGIMPSSSAMLLGPVVSLPATHGQGSNGNPGRAPSGAGIPATASTTPGGHHPGAGHSNPGIVFDPQQDTYVNSRHGNRPQAPTAGAGPLTTNTPGANPGRVQQVPVGGYETRRQTEDDQGYHQSDPNSSEPVPAGRQGGAWGQGNHHSGNQDPHQNNPPTGGNSISPVPVTGHEGSNPGTNTGRYATPTTEGNTSHGQGTSGLRSTPSDSRGGGQTGGTHGGGGGGGSSSGGHAGGGTSSGGGSTSSAPPSGGNSGGGHH